MIGGSRLAIAAAVVLLSAGCAGNSPTATGTTPASTSASTPASTPTAGSSTAAPAPTSAVAGFAHWRLATAVAREGLVDAPGQPGQVLLTGGMLPGDQSTGNVVRLELATGRSHPMPPLGVPVHDLASGLFAGKPATFGGGNATEQSVVQVLSTGTWHPATHLPTTRSDLSAVPVGGWTYVIGGYDGVNVPRDILRVGAAGVLRKAGRLATGVRYAATAAVGSSVYVFGGEVNHRELGAVQRFETATGRTAVVATLPRPLGHAVAATVGGRILLIGGRIDPDTQTAAMWWFDPATTTFTRAGSLPVATSDAAVATRDSTIWVVGGEAPQVTDRVIVIHVS